MVVEIRCQISSEDICFQINGSDIGVADKREGATCLTHSVHTKEICKHVIEHGAIVNAVNDRRDTAVYYMS